VYDITGFVMILPRPLLAAVAAVIWLLTAIAARKVFTKTTCPG